MTKRKLTLVALALTLVLCLLPTTALAIEWDLANGDVHIYTEGSTQYVSQAGAERVEDIDPTITTKKAEVNNKLITVESKNGATVNLALKDVVVVSNNGTIMNIKGNTAAVVTLVEMNGFLLDDTSKKNEAAVHVSSGSLTIVGDGLLIISKNGGGAGIGSNSSEDFTGNIHITDDAKVVPTCIKIQPGEDVSIEAGSGAGIGAGEKGDFSGTIEIDENATVLAIGGKNAAAIGSAGNGTFSGGSISIEDEATVIAFGNGEGTAIGSADDTPMNGSIVIKDNTLVAVRGGDKAADIGMEGYGEGAGSIEISGNAMVVKYGNEPLILGNEVVDEPSNIQITLGEDVVLNFVPGAEVLAGNGGDAVQINSTLPVERYIPETPNYYAQGELYRVVDKDGNAVAYDESVEDGVVTITAAKGASLVGALEDIQMLSRKGSVLRFVTGDVVSTVELAEFYHGVGAQTDEVVLSHNGGRTLTIGGVDYTALIK